MVDIFSEEYENHIKAAKKYSEAWAEMSSFDPLETQDSTAASLPAYSLACEAYVDSVIEYCDSFKAVGFEEPHMLRESVQNVIEQRNIMNEENQTIIDKSNNEIASLKTKLINMPDLTNNIITLEEWIFGCYPDLKTLIESDWDSCGYDMMEVYDGNGDYVTTSEGRDDWFARIDGFQDVKIDLVFPLFEKLIDFEYVAKKLDYDSYESEKEDVLCAIPSEYWEDMLHTTGGKIGEAKLSAYNDAFASSREYYIKSFKYVSVLQNEFIKLYKEGLINDSNIVELASKKFVWVIFKQYENATYYKFDSRRDVEQITFNGGYCERFNIQEALKDVLQ